MRNHYGYLTRKNKIILGLIGVVLGIACAVYLNTNYLQARMRGQWTVADANVSFSEESVPKQVEISLQRIKFNGKERVRIKYGGQSTGANFFRRDIDGSIVYYFEADNVIISYNKKNPDELLLLTLPEVYDGAAYNAYLLERKEE